MRLRYVLCPTPNALHRYVLPHSHVRHTSPGPRTTPTNSTNEPGGRTKTQHNSRQHRDERKERNNKPGGQRGESSRNLIRHKNERLKTKRTGQWRGRRGMETDNHDARAKNKTTPPGPPRGGGGGWSVGKERGGGGKALGTVQGRCGPVLRGESNSLDDGGGGGGGGSPLASLAGGDSPRIRGTRCSRHGIAPPPPKAKEVCGPQIALQFQGCLLDILFVPRTIVLMWVGWGVGGGGGADRVRRSPRWSLSN